MARKSSSPRRIRALQSTATDASQQKPTDETQPRKRGRPRRSLDTDAEEIPTDSKPPRKRGRPSLGAGKSPVATKSQVGRKRGRPSLGARSGPIETKDLVKRKRGRPSLGQKKIQDGAVQEQEEETQPSKPGRKNKPEVSTQEEPEEPQETEEQQPPVKRKRGRPSLQHSQPPEANKQDAEPASGSERRPRGRPPGRRKSLEDQQTSISRRHSGATDQEEERNDHLASAPARRSSQIAQPEADAPPKSYPHVAPRVRGIKQSIIDAKWKPLSAPSIAAATETLALAHRPIMQRVAGTQQRRQHVSAALSQLQRRISRKLHRGMPFPPPAIPAAGVPRKRGRRPKAGGGDGHEAELDFESVLDGARALERRLDPALHAVELLRKEKAWMERELEQDYKTLRNLEAGARGQARQQRDQLKKAHVLAPEVTIPREKREEDVEMVFDHEGSVPPGTLFKGLEDGELKELALQLGGHMDSIKTNLQQTEGLVPQMASSGAALRSVLLRHLSQDQYDKVVLG